MKNLLAKKIIFSSVLAGSLLIQGHAAMGQTRAMLLRDYPQSYTVQNGDTLWHIASQFLVDPDNWSDLWTPSPYMDGEGAAIFPGDVIEVEFVEGRPRLVSQRGSLPVERISPQIKEIELTSNIPAIPLEDIYNSLTKNRIVPLESYQNAPYVLTPMGNNLVIGTGDEIYARGDWSGSARSFEIYRQINSFNDPETGDPMGVELETVGFATIIRTESEDIKKMIINSSNREVKVGDRLLVREETRLEPTIYPTEPSNEISANILSMTNTERMASQLDTVLLNVGANENLKIGDVLKIQQRGERMVDLTERQKKSFSDKFKAFATNEKLDVPSKDIGTLMVYKVFDKLSYAVILSSHEPARSGDMVVNP